MDGCIMIFLSSDWPHAKQIMVQGSHHLWRFSSA